MPAPLSLRTSALLASWAALSIYLTVQSPLMGAWFVCAASQATAAMAALYGYALASDMGLYGLAQRTQQCRTLGKCLHFEAAIAAAFVLLSLAGLAIAGGIGAGPLLVAFVYAVFAACDVAALAGKSAAVAAFLGASEEGNGFGRDGNSSSSGANKTSLAVNGRAVKQLAVDFVRRLLAGKRNVSAAESFRDAPAVARTMAAKGIFHVAALAVVLGYIGPAVSARAYPPLVIEEWGEADEG